MVQLMVNGRIFFDFAKSIFPDRTKRCKFSLPEHALAIAPFPSSILVGNGESSFCVELRQYLVLTESIAAI